MFICVYGEDITFINSNDTRYTKDNVSCSGDVIIVYYGRIISADKILYDRKEEIIHADGNVIIKDEKQNTYFLDSLYVKKNFSSGEGKNVKIIMTDKSRLAAMKCSIKDEKYKLEQAIYTPCYECTSGELTWQMKAFEVVFDPKEYVEYRDAQFEVLNAPIVYMPYFAHVSSKVKRKSGFLVPKLSTSSRNGFSILPQYLWAISDSQELILKPIITSKAGLVGWTYYGLRFPNGEFNVDASITDTQSIKDKKNDCTDAIKKIQGYGYRGHIFSKMRYEINDVWRCGFDINLASDKYYLKRFSFLGNADRALESSINLEGFEGRNYSAVRTIMFQNTNLDGINLDCIPRVLPMMERNYSTYLLSGTLNWDTYFINLDFSDQRSSQKLVSNVFWSKEVLFPGGHLIDLNGTLSFVGLKVSEKTRSEYDSLFCVIPQLNFMWKWPLLLSFESMDTIFTPILGIIMAGNKKYADVFEGQFCEITDMNFFHGNRSISSYNVDSGNRVYYGLKLAGYRNGENLYRFTVGRSTELISIIDKLEASGLKHKSSNVVAALDVFLSSRCTLVANASYSTQSKHWTRIETGINFLDNEFCFNVMVFRGRQCFYNPFSIVAVNFSEAQKTQKYKGIAMNIGFHVTKAVKLKGGLVMGNDQEAPVTINVPSDNRLRLIRHNIGIEYNDECTTVDFAVERRNYKGGDLKPETVFQFVVHLKNLGI
jgi:LPS-assembly protein